MRGPKGSVVRQPRKQIGRQVAIGDARCLETNHFCMTFDRSPDVLNYGERAELD